MIAFLPAEWVDGEEKEIAVKIQVVDRSVPLWKGIRSRFQMNRIALFSESPFMTDFENVSRILDLRNAILDTSKAGKMRDAYCLKMFTFENTIKLLREQDYIDACFFLPFASWISANFSISIDLPFRLFLLELSFQIISTFLEQFPDLKKNRILQKAVEGIEAVTLHENQYIMRMLKTLIGSAVALIYPDYIRNPSDGVGTHLVENCISLLLVIRNIIKGIQQASNISSNNCMPRS